MQEYVYFHGDKEALKIIRGKVCPYCKEKTELIDSKEIYGRSYGNAYLCRICNAYCGCHKGTTESYGMVANERLRGWRGVAHSAFDGFWQGKASGKRNKVYRSLAHHLKLPKDKCHIGMFGIETCQKVIQFCRNRIIVSSKERRNALKSVLTL